MAKYAVLAVDSGARIIGGCCGTSPEHLAEMKRASTPTSPDRHPRSTRSSTTVGPLAEPVSRADIRTRERLGSPSRDAGGLQPGIAHAGSAAGCLEVTAALFEARSGVPWTIASAWSGAAWVDMERLAQSFHQALLGDPAVAGLAALFVDDDPDLRPEAVDHPLALYRPKADDARGRAAIRRACATGWRVARPVRPTSRTTPAAHCAGSGPSASRQANQAQSQIAMIYARTAKVGPGCREVRAGADRATRPLSIAIGPAPASGWSVADAERTSGRRNSSALIVTRSPAGPGRGSVV